MDVGFAALLIWQIGLYFAFDLLLLNGDDLRELPLVERKARLKTLIRKRRSRMLYVDHIEQRGCEFCAFTHKIAVAGSIKWQCSLENA